MNKWYVFLLFLVLGVSACSNYDEDVVGITGIYEANIIGLTGPHSVSVGYDRGDDIVIEAPFDGYVWITIFADVDDQQDNLKRIYIDDQEVGPNIFIYGEGTYLNGTLQLDYTMDFGYEIADFRLIGSQF